MRRATLLLASALLVSACSPTALVPAARPNVAPTATAVLPTVSPTPTALPPTPEPSAIPTIAPTVEVLPPTALPGVTVTRFADLPGNVAKGEAAPDFTARVMGGSTFTLSEQRGSPVLLFPTVVGCGDCVSRMQEIAAAYPSYRGRGIKVVILDLYPEDAPKLWQPFADYIGEPAFIWGVVNSSDFAVQYNIASLGTTMLVDQEGKLVFRSKYPVRADGFRQLFDLAAR